MILHAFTQFSKQKFLINAFDYKSVEYLTFKTQIFNSMHRNEILKIYLNYKVN